VVVVLVLARSRVTEERAEEVPGDEGGRVVIEGRGEAMVDIVEVMQILGRLKLDGKGKVLLCVVDYNTVRQRQDM